MPLRLVVLSALLALLAGCAKPPAEQQPRAALELESAPQALYHELRGSLLGAPAGSNVELALLAVDRHDQPDRLLTNVRLIGRGSELPFLLRFNHDKFPSDQRVELRGRVTQGGQLIMRLKPQTIHSAASQALGALRLVPAP